MDLVRCLDTYALIEIRNGNPKFAHFISSIFVIADITLAEFYSVVLRDQGEEKAEYWFNKFQNSSIQVSLPALIGAVKFRYKHKDKNLSWVDAIGYTFAKENNYIFVTGDKEFENLENVEYIKK